MIYGKSFTSGPAGYRILTPNGRFPSSQYQIVLFDNDTPVASTVVEMA